jgi:pyruvate formate lyase activating enzyme
LKNAILFDFPPGVCYNAIGAYEQGSILTRRDFLKKIWLFIIGAGGLMLGGRRLLGEVKPEEKKSLFKARYYRKLEDNKIQCDLCFRNCIVLEGGRGFCRNKENRNGEYYTLVYNKPCALHVDPVEKEPAYHLLPGKTIFCLATASCNNRCKFCHNWHISQSSVEETINYNFTPRKIVEAAKNKACVAVSFTYSEPVVFYEYMFDIAKCAKESGLKTLCHTNGLINEEPLSALIEHMDAFTVDLKGFSEKFYDQLCSSKLAPVLASLKKIKESKTHLEIVNLLIPGLNDYLKDIEKMCLWIKENLGEDVPLHFSRFFPSYKLQNLPPTPVATIEKAREIAVKVGLHYVSIGNVPGHKYNSTFCPGCGKRLIHRVHFRVYRNNIKKGKCKFCGEQIPGIWN